MTLLLLFHGQRPDTHDGADGHKKYYAKSSGPIFPEDYFKKKAKTEIDEKPALVEKVLERVKRKPPKKESMSLYLQGLEKEINLIDKRLRALATEEKRIKDYESLLRKTALLKAMWLYQNMLDEEAFLLLIM